MIARSHFPNHRLLDTHDEIQSGLTSPLLYGLEYGRKRLESHYLPLRQHEGLPLSLAQDNYSFRHPRNYDPAAIQSVINKLRKFRSEQVHVDARLSSAIIYYYDDGCALHVPMLRDSNDSIGQPFTTGLRPLGPCICPFTSSCEKHRHVPSVVQYDYPTNRFNYDFVNKRLGTPSYLTFILGCVLPDLSLTYLHDFADPDRPRRRSPRGVKRLVKTRSKLPTLTDVGRADALYSSPMRPFSLPPATHSPLVRPPDLAGKTSNEIERMEYQSFSTPPYRSFEACHVPDGFYHRHIFHHPFTAAQEEHLRHVFHVGFPYPDIFDPYNGEFFDFQLYREALLEKGLCLYPFTRPFPYWRRCVNIILHDVRHDVVAVPPMRKSNTARTHRRNVEAGLDPSDDATRMEDALSTHTFIYPASLDFVNNLVYLRRIGYNPFQCTPDEFVRVLRGEEVVLGEPLLPDVFLSNALVDGSVNSLMMGHRLDHLHLLRISRAEPLYWERFLRQVLLNGLLGNPRCVNLEPLDWDLRFGVNSLMFTARYESAAARICPPADLRKCLVSFVRFSQVLHDKQTYQSVGINSYDRLPFVADVVVEGLLGAIDDIIREYHLVELSELDDRCFGKELKHIISCMFTVLESMGYDLATDVLAVFHSDDDTALDSEEPCCYPHH